MIKKVMAFTIMEITVAMLIAAIAIGMAYACFIIIYKSYGSFKTRQTELVEIGQLNRVLQRDFEKGDIILQSRDGIIIKNSTRQIEYNIQPEYILRTAETVDTFKVNTAEVTRYFEGQPLSDPSEREEQNRIDKLTFTIICHNEKFPYYYFKQYSSQNLVNRNPDAFN